MLPMNIVNDFMEHRLQQRMDHDLYGLRPNHRFFEQHPTVNDALCNLLSSGHIVITVGIKYYKLTYCYYFYRRMWRLLKKSQ